MTSFTVSFTGTSSVLQADFLPEIILNPNSEYCCGLLDFTTFNSIANIENNRNSDFQFTYKAAGVDKGKTISLPTGSYEVEDILKNLKAEIAKEKIVLTYEINVPLLKVRLAFDTEIVWIGGTLLNVLGFEKSGISQFKKNWKYQSNDIVRITQLDVIRIECDIVSGSYINGKPCRTIHQFSNCKVSPGHKFIEIPRHIIYLPIKQNRLSSIQISVVDQSGNLIDFRGEQISCRIHIKEIT